MFPSATFTESLPSKIGTFPCRSPAFALRSALPVDERSYSKYPVPHEQQRSLPAAYTLASTAPSDGTASAATSIQSLSPTTCFISLETATDTVSAFARLELSRWRSNITPQRRFSLSTFLIRG